MQMQLTTVNQWVHDQDEALEFYTEKLGMELRDDVTVPEMGNFRWLTVGPVGQPDIAVVLMAIPGPPVFEPETTAQLQDLVAKGASGGLFFQTDDIQGTYEELKGKGVEFTQEPTKQPYGIDAGFRDPSGNQIRGSCRTRRRDRVAGGLRAGGALPSWSADRQQVDDEHERLVRRDHAARTPGAVGHRRRDRQLAPSADPHPLRRPRPSPG